MFYFATFRQNAESPSGSTPKTITNNITRTSYMPGKEYGAGVDGTSTNPLSTKVKRNRRSAYSTKLISLRSISDNSVAGYANPESNYIESSNTPSASGSLRTPEDIKIGPDIIANPLNPADLSEFGSELYF